MKSSPVILERTFNAPISKVWKAISDKNEMKHWYFDLKEFKPEVGFIFEFTGGPDDGKHYLHLCEVTEVELESKLTYSWRYDGYEGKSFVTFELFPKGDSTLLRLTHTSLETFPKSNPDFNVANFVAGWDEIIHVSLKNHLEK
ncbi:MAG TPA: SRPBCC domain-containing protein [Aquaticitalea sp.]|nr:SRPBCC domain-containing protein [Aquaticitalea sp.]